MRQRCTIICAVAVRRGYALLALALGALLFPTYCLAAGYPPAQDRYVNDYAHVLTAADAADIRARFADFERDRGVVVVLLTISSIGDYDTPDTSIESFATNLFNTWGIGDAQRNDGVLILFAKNDRRVRIEVGRGYGKSLDAPMQQVMNTALLPAFKREQYSSGLAAGARSVVDAIVLNQSGAQSTASGAGGWPFMLIGGGLLASAGAALFRRSYILAHTCPQCSQRNLQITRATLVAPSYSSSGSGVKTRHCASCGYHDESSYTIAQLHDTSSDSSYGGDSGGGGGGGSSDGGGASGSW